MNNVISGPDIDESSVVRPVGLRSDGLYFQPVTGEHGAPRVVAIAPNSDPKRMYFISKQPKRILADCDVT